MVSAEEIKALMLAMKRRYNFDFTNYEPKSLGRGITRLMAKHDMESMADLWERILKEDDFFLNGIDELLVNLTELFRNPDAWVMIRDEILPKFKANKQLDVWHAGCSTGEEIYTMTILLEELGMLYKSKLLATDLSNIALNKARLGKYSNNTLNNYMTPFMKIYPNKKLEDFFQFDEHGGQIKRGYQRNVEFRKNNLVDRKMDRKFDIIFCRNVMIYFDGELKKRIFTFFNECLNDGGYLILGYYDTMPNHSIDIYDVYNNTTRIYKKKAIQLTEI
ncbi:MAG: protein-glutamate O-methyltransferase CheR [Reichenbachiella sp.]